MRGRGLGGCRMGAAAHLGEGPALRSRSSGAVHLRQYILMVMPPPHPPTPKELDRVDPWEFHRRVGTMYDWQYIARRTERVYRNAIRVGATTSLLAGCGTLIHPLPYGGGVSRSMCSQQSAHSSEATHTDTLTHRHGTLPPFGAAESARRQRAWPAAPLLQVRQVVWKALLLYYCGGLDVLAAA